MQTIAVPKRLPKNDSELWQRFISCLMDLPKPKSVRQEDIAREIKVGQTSVSGYKTGDKVPSMQTARALAAYAEMCVEFLLTGNGPERPWGHVDAEFAKVMHAWEHLDDVNRTKLIEYAEQLIVVQTTKRRPRWEPPPPPLHKPPKRPQH